MGKVEDQIKSLANNYEFDLLEAPIRAVAHDLGGEIAAVLLENAERVRTVGGLWGRDGDAVRAAIGRRKPHKDLAGWLIDRSHAREASWAAPTEALPTFRTVGEAKDWMKDQGCGRLTEVTVEHGGAPYAVRHALVAAERRRMPASAVGALDQTLWRAIERARRALERRKVLANRGSRSLAIHLEHQERAVRRLNAECWGFPLAAPPVPAIGSDRGVTIAVGDHRQGVRSFVYDGQPPPDWRPPGEDVDARIWALESFAGTFGASLLLRDDEEPWERALATLTRPAVSGGRPPVAGQFPRPWLLLKPVRTRCLVSAVRGPTLEPYPPLPDLVQLPLEDRALLLLAQAQWLDARGLVALVDHPRLLNAEGLSVDVQTAALSLHIRPSGTSALEVRFGAGAEVPADPVEQPQSVGALIVPISARRLHIVDVSTHQLLWFRDLERLTKVTFPLGTFPTLYARLQSFQGAFDVHVDPSLIESTIAADPEPVLHLTRTGGGVQANLLVRPGPGLEPRRPGTGEPRIYVPPNLLVRDLGVEQEKAARAAAALGWTSLETQELATTDDLAALLTAAAGLTPPVRVAWEGPPRKVLRKVVSRDLRLKMTRMADMLTLGGSAEVDGVLIDLAALMAAASTGERFVVVEGGIAEISQDLAAHLREIARVAGVEDPALPPLATDAVQALAQDGADLDGPPDWSARWAAARAAQGLVIEVPPTLQATLRPYQVYGFQWLARQATWAPGMLLCDDMGLGKTVQTLALLLHRAADGAALVVAPTSVVFNWAREAEKFAPSLQVHVHQGARRSLTQVQAGELWITSWDLLVRDLATLRDLPFATIVFDEAQAAKNPESQRAIAARSLNGGFVVVVTGTPMENRLADLWSLASFGIPGLLGSWADFRARFAYRIERDEDPEARATLRRLLGAFLLRRTKSQVAPDLPPRTEILERLTLSSAERVVYEQARLEALAMLRSSLAPQQRRFQILASLTRLRQIACDARILGASIGVPTKEARLVERCLEVASEDGASLVFSSFVRLLERAEPALQAAGLRTRRLDGSTPPAVRRRMIDEFQAGEADVFLISLKAGGSGLNLTRADTVFHLDPWWNPAAEAQATDRAHRIGQTQPVTVYRMVAEGTVEEAVIAMQAEKQAMIAALLADDAPTAPIDVDALASLLMDHP